MDDLTELATIFEERRKDLLRVFRKHGWNETKSEDLFQDTYVSAQRNYHSFKGNSRLFSWVIGIARNLSKNELRFHSQQKRDRSKEQSLDDPERSDLATSTNSDPESQVIKREKLAFFLAEIEKMPPRMQACIRLRYIEEEPVAFIATVLSISENTVKSQNFQARQRLRNAWDRYLDGRHE